MPKPADNDGMVNPPLPSSERAPLAQPASLSELYWAFTFLALQGFGGVVAVVQRELVDRKKWLSTNQFVEDWAVAQVLPGANIVNLSLMVGDRYFGTRGGMVALAGLISIPLVLVLILAALFAGVSDSAAVQGALRGMGAVAAGMIAATGIKMLAALKQNPLGTTAALLLAALTFIATALLRLPLSWVLLSLGGAGIFWAYRQLGRLQKAAA